MNATAPFNVATHNGIITILNPATGNHRTFKIVTTDWTATQPGTRWAKMLTGGSPGDFRNWKSFARVVNGRCVVFRKLAESEFYVGVCKILNHPERYTDRLEFMFEGRCIRCGRHLTNPESIESGIGPECRKAGR